MTICSCVRTGIFHFNRCGGGRSWLARQSEFTQIFFVNLRVLPDFAPVFLLWTQGTMAMTRAGSADVSGRRHQQ
jgi:hypothetical protein